MNDRDIGIKGIKIKLFLDLQAIQSVLSAEIKAKFLNGSLKELQIKEGIYPIDQLIFWQQAYKPLKKLLWLWFGLSISSFLYWLLSQQLFAFLIFCLALSMTFALLLTQRLLKKRKQYQLIWTLRTGELSLVSLKDQLALCLGNVSEFQHLRLKQARRYQQNTKGTHYELLLESQKQIPFVLCSGDSQKTLMAMLWQCENAWAMFRLESNTAIDESNTAIDELNPSVESLHSMDKGIRLRFDHDVSKSRLLSILFFFLMLGNLGISYLLGWGIEAGLFIFLSVFMLFSLLLSYFADRFFFYELQIESDGTVKLQRMHLPTKLGKKLSDQMKQVIQAQDVIDLVYYPHQENKLMISIYYQHPKKSDQCLKLDLYEDQLTHFEHTIKRHAQIQALRQKLKKSRSFVH